MARRGENIRKRVDGRWEARIIIGYDDSGKAIYKSVYGKTYIEVREKKKLVIQQGRIIQVPIKSCKITVGQLMKEWLEYMKHNVKESTFAKYTHLVNAHILPKLGECELRKLDNKKMDMFTRDKLLNGKLNGSGGLSPKTVTDLLSLISQAIQFAKERNYPYPQNLVIHYPKQSKPQIQVLSVNQQQKLERVLFNNEDMISMGILISLYTGMRIGEICALKWENINLEDKTIYVRRTLMRIQETNPESRKRTKILITKPKSDSSIRIIPIASFLIPYLQSMKKNSNCYFLTGTSDYMEPRAYFQKYKKLMSECRLDNFNYHALRHTFATRCVEKGFDIKSLSEILGHSDVTITLRRYVHPSLDIKKQQMELLKSAIC